MIAGNVQHTSRRAAGGIVGYAPVPSDVLEDATATATAYSAHLARSGLALGTIAQYSRKVSAFAEWLTAQPDHRAGDVHTDPWARDHAMRDYRTHLLTERRLAAPTIDLALTAVDQFFVWLGIGPSTVKRVGSAAMAAAGYGESLNPAQTRAVLRAAERRGARDLSLVGMMRFTGIRVEEAHRVNVDDAWVSARRGEVEVRGKGGSMRSIPLNAGARDALRPWLDARRANVGADTQPALWLTTTGERLAIRSMRHVVVQVGKAAGVDLHPHLLRHSFARGLIDAGVPVSDVQRYMGHRSVNTTTLYTKPSAEQHNTAIEVGTVEW